MFQNSFTWSKKLNVRKKKCYKNKERTNKEKEVSVREVLAKAKQQR